VVVLFARVLCALEALSEAVTKHFGETPVANLKLLFILESQEVAFADGEVPKEGPKWIKWYGLASSVSRIVSMLAPFSVLG
jgi:hypothetical protein